MRRSASAGLLEALPFPGAILDAAGRILAGNAALARLSGTSGAPVEGTSLFEVLPAIGEPALARLREGMTHGGVDLDLRVTSAAGAPRDLRLRIRSFRDGSATLALAIVSEAAPTDEARRDAAAYEAALQIASHVRHEINNPLMGIMGCVELLLARSDLDETVRVKIETIGKEADRIRDRTRELSAIRRS